MLTRHSVDTSLRYDRLAQLPDRREIEVAGEPPAPDRPRTQERTREPYLASVELEEAVNVAIALGRPLLLQGDPGAGKTRLAHAVSYALGLPLEEAYVKSTSRGQDLLYTYDAVRRLYDTQTGRGAGRFGRPAPGDGDYVRLGPLGRAIVRAGHGRRSMVLIDEIDKADIDFPNDLLRELDQLAFDVAEVPGVRHAVPVDRPDLRPVIVVTNNEEKALPAAFLRRCVFHHVRFPATTAELDAILALHGIGDVQLREEAIGTLHRLRGMDLAKKPGLSELLDWVSYLQATGVRPGDGRLPYAGVLIKQHADALRLER
ncbi:MoxR family ATPase [Dactylosporangium aurantiacum]|uniref:MoxR family ATPase n=1 Tax=Dactylosporangium aurantiacum TaxID=35754 RepID=A0A9Q9I9R9_9ACTN|nr:MoxR family ATPase [Dactylosporangium aurantiacum]MDG6109653.1 MoxR family ATPase [Dactylosporangium aurantiacum]UWZ50268.1 MoxR family ATPase [Dactylosporangium aurantiacum]